MLLSDLATTLDAQGRFDEAYACAQRAAELARRGEHPELHVLLRNLAAILTHRGGQRGAGPRAGGGGGRWLSAPLASGDTAA